MSVTWTQYKANKWADKVRNMKLKAAGIKEQLYSNLLISLRQRNEEVHLSLNSVLDLGLSRLATCSDMSRHMWILSYYSSSYFLTPVSFWSNSHLLAQRFVCGFATSDEASKLRFRQYPLNGRLIVCLIHFRTNFKMLIIHHFKAL